MVTSFFAGCGSCDPRGPLANIDQHMVRMRKGFRRVDDAKPLAPGEFDVPFDLVLHRRVQPLVVQCAVGCLHAGQEFGKEPLRAGAAL